MEKLGDGAVPNANGQIGRSLPPAAPLAALCTLLTALALVSCTKSPTGPQEELVQAAKGVYVVNEGNFMRGNSSLTFYVPDSGKTYPDVFFTANGRPLGDTGNDMVLFGGRGYIVVNNSQKIEVIELANHKSVGVVTLPSTGGRAKSPYKLVVLDAARGYVTNLGDNSVTVFNPTTLQISKERIEVGRNPQGITAAQGKIYVCNSGFGLDSTVSVIDPAADAVMKTIVVGVGPSEIAAAGAGFLVVKCDGAYNDFNDPNDDVPGSLVLINSATNEVLSRRTLPLDVFGHPGRMALSAKGYGYISVMGGVLRFDVGGSALTLHSTPLLTLFAYGLAVDDVTERIYVTDAKDYVQPGSVAIYEKSGQKLTEFAAGIIPSVISFKR